MLLHLVAWQVELYFGKIIRHRKGLPQPNEISHKSGGSWLPQSGILAYFPSMSEPQPPHKPTPSSTPTARFFGTLAGHTIVYGFATLLRPLSQLLLVRLHTNTHFVDVDEFAAWSLLQIALNVGIVVFNMGVATAFFRHYLLAETEEERTRVLSRAFRLSVTLAFVLGGTLYLTAGAWSTWLVGASGYAGPARDVALAIFGNTLTIVPLALLRADGRKTAFVLYNAGRFVALIGLNAWFLIWLDWGLDGITRSMAASNLVMALFFLPMVLRRLNRERWTTGWNTLLKYGAPLIAIEMVIFLLNGIGQKMLEILASQQEVALFGFALRIAFLAQVSITMPFYVAFQPNLFRVQREAEDPRPLYARTMGYIWTIALAVALGVTLLAPELARILGKNPFYYQAAPHVLWLAFSVAFYGIFVVFSSGASLKDRTWVFPLVLLVAGVCEVGLAYALIPAHGVGGAALATFAGYAVLAVLTFFTNQWVYPIRFPWGRVALTTVVTAVVLLARQWLPGGDLFLMRVGLLAVYPVLLLVGGYLDKGERAALQRWFAKRG